MNDELHFTGVIKDPMFVSHMMDGICALIWWSAMQVCECDYCRADRIARVWCGEKMRVGDVDS